MGNSASTIPTSTQTADYTLFNSLIEKVNEQTSCDADCQKQKEEEALKKKWDESKTNLLSGPSQEHDAEKNYITYVEGSVAYDELQNKRLNERATKIATTFQTSFDNISKRIETQIGTYQGIFLNFKNVVELYLKYKEENLKLAKELKENVNDVLTNERKTYYKDQGIEKMKVYYYYIILVLYIICVLCFGFFALVYPSKSNWKVRLLTFIALILLPFVSTYILGFIFLLKNFLVSAIPKMAAKNKMFNFFNNA